MPYWQAGGWFLWNKQKDTDANTATPVVTSDPTVVAAGDTLTITEWGVQTTVPTDEAGTTYTYVATANTPAMGGVTFSFPTSKSMKQTSTCDVGSMKWGLVRYGPTDKVNQSEQTYAELDWSNSTTVKKVGEYYYVRVYPQIGCDDAENAPLGAKQEAASKQMLVTLEPVQ